MRTPLAAAYDRLLAGLGLVAGLSIAWIAVMVSLDVVLRNMGIINFPWLLEVSEYVLYLATFLAAPWVLSLGGHVRVDVLVTTLPRHFALSMEIIADIVGLATTAIFLGYSLDAAVSSYVDNAILFKELVFPEWYLMTVMPLSSMLLVIEFLRRLTRAISGRPMIEAKPPDEGF